MLKLIVVGAAGRMGRQIIFDALRDHEIEVVGAIDAPGAPQIGEDIGRLCDYAPTGVTVESCLKDVIKRGQAVVDFSVAAAVPAHLEVARSSLKPYALGTTGLAPETRAAISAAAEDIPILVAPNMSLGINLLASVLPSMIRAIDGGYDIEVIEAHHRFKLDAPSGTALWLTGIIESTLRGNAPSSRVFGRQGLAPRQPGEIGVHAVRGGGNPGEHRLLFANEGEQIELVHRAFSRQTYSLGALRAVKFLVRQPPGLYDMQDVIADLLREEI
ncbi:MAG: 4-hydroxy-tetrahydrodipicolinate reductase [Chloroflexota bacterium]